MSRNISNEQLAVMIEEVKKNNDRVVLALFGDEENEEPGLIKEMKEIKVIITTSKTLWDALKTIGKWVIGLSAFTAASMYLKHLWDGDISQINTSK